MKHLINILCIIGVIIFMAAALTAETHMMTSAVWCVIGALLIAPHLRLTYLRESR